MKKNYYFWSSLALVLIALCSCSKSEKTEITDLDVFGFKGPVTGYTLAEVETDMDYTALDSATIIQTFEFEDGRLVKIDDTYIPDSCKRYDEMGRLTTLTRPNVVEIDGILYDYVENLEYDKDDNLMPGTVFFLYLREEELMIYNPVFKFISYDEDGYELQSVIAQPNPEAGDTYTASFYHVTSTDDYGNWTSRYCVTFSVDEDLDEWSPENCLKLDPNPVCKIEYQQISYDE